MAPGRQKTKDASRIQSKSKGRRGGGFFSSRSSSSGVHPANPQETILRYLQSSSPLPTASERRTPTRAVSSGTLRSDFSSATSNSTFASRSGNGSGTNHVAINTTFPEPLSSSLSLSSDISLPTEEPSGNVTLRRGRDFNKPLSSRPLVRRHYGGEEYIPGAFFQMQPSTCYCNTYTKSIV
ncbi:uncharacterized protein B0J16DRAFT_120813 [Fusarium flagelliforme]|uniref:uncharacterized protein n=1 Tax=Fusarium flagelliforme TaxID=2675880 RepID=UPI001E8D8A9E|nr:uncharacterized protein B0J16DRAFT_48852 [Fusarium flagelliforme]XP_045982147.1 uncharacterized protein B0J16DRAFT_120813 [Fusarium flagelliforme]KAH7169650.1 hypothetical protein B0J16DRAFT_48852 [Fusarium flagelliforme]KAH7184515.1 hypothetical protein B0J16DRAFT_120813 [Fusarium flagelliforme]